MLVHILQQKVTGPTGSSADWVLCSEELTSKFNSHTKAIIINNPSNPLGKVSSLHLLSEFNVILSKYSLPNGDVFHLLRT